MLHVDICEVEVHALHQHVGGDECLLAIVVENGTVIPHPIHRGGILGLEILCQSVDKSEFS